MNFVILIILYIGNNSKNNNSKIASNKKEKEKNVRFDEDQGHGEVKDLSGSNNKV